MVMKKAVILISGGLDSTTCLAHAKDVGFACYTLSFDYGQKQVYELTAAKNIAKAYGALEHKVIDLSSLGALGGSALTDEKIDVPDYDGADEIPVTYVPARNTVFLSVALGWAEVLGAYDIFIGTSSIDYSGYPDCRPEYIAAFQQMADLATKTGVEGKPIRFNTPLIELSKAETINMGLALGVDYGQTVSCYSVDEQGRACGRCDACTFRRKGFIELGVADPTRYVEV